MRLHEYISACRGRRSRPGTPCTSKVSAVYFVIMCGAPGLAGPTTIADCTFRVISNTTSGRGGPAWCREGPIASAEGFSMNRPEWAPEGVDMQQASPARMYD